MKYRIVSIVLIFVMLLVLANGLSVSAEVSYEELLEQSKKDPNHLIRILVVEHRGVEPLTSTMRMSRATICYRTH